MIDPKAELEQRTMKKVHKIITKAIEEKHELKIDENLETNIENFTISHDDFLDYATSVNDLLSYSEAVLSKYVGNFYNHFEKCDFTKEEFFKYLTLVGQVWKVLDENVTDKEFSGKAKFNLEDYFDDIMTGIRRKIYELNFDQTDVWKELEKRIDKDILEPKFPEKIMGGRKVTFSKEIEKIMGGRKVTFSNETEKIQDDKIEKLNQEISFLKKHEKKNIGKTHSRFWLKRELASAIGITICGECGIKTKIEKIKEISGVGKFGYAVCPKCGHKEEWMYGHP